MASLASLAALASLTFAAGCTVTPPVSVVHTPADDEALHGDPVKMRRGAQEAYAGIKGGFYVVRGVEDWQNAWPAGQQPALPSTLDTSSSMLLLTVSEAKDDIQVRVTKVLETGNLVHIWVHQTKAGSGCTPKLEQTPYDAVIVPRIDKPVKFYVDEEQGETCGEPPAANVKCRVAGGATWGAKLIAAPGDNIECELTAEARGRFALTDKTLTIGSLPGGSGSKLSYTKGPTRAAFSIDVYGTYSVKGEAVDEAGRHGVTSAEIEVMPPKTHDPIVTLVWTNFDASDDPDTFPRVKLRAKEDGGRGRECSVEKATPDLCEVKTRSAYTHMKIKASDKRMPLSVDYVDERAEKGPLVCVQVYLDGARTAESCDRKHRDAEEKWEIGSLDLFSGRIIEPGGDADAGAPAAPSAQADGGAPPAAGATPAAGGDAPGDFWAKKPAAPAKPAPKKK